MNIRRGMMAVQKELPFGYKEIEYISATGQQYIATDYVPKIGDQITTKFLLTSNVNQQALFSAGTGDYQLIFLKYGSSDDFNAWYKYFATGGATTLTWNLAYGVWHELKINAVGNVVSGSHSNVSSPVHELDGNNSTLYLFIRRNTNNPVTGSLRKFIITHDGKKTLALIPCVRKSDNIAGMYDTVGKKFYGSSGSEQFIAGPDV